MNDAHYTYMYQTKTCLFTVELITCKKKKKKRETILMKHAHMYLQLLCWMFHNDILPTSEQLNTCLMCTSVILQTQQLSAVIGQKDHVSWVASIASCIYQVFLSCK